MPAKDLTALLQAWSAGNEQAGDELLALVYAELRLLARRYMRKERSGHTLQSTALVHEAYLRLMDKKDVRWQDRAHFFAIAAREMRRILVEQARAKKAEKRGGLAVKLPIEDVEVAAAQKDGELLALEEALKTLETLDPQQARIVELRYFAGLTMEELALVLEVSTSTVERKWRTARAWLYREVGQIGEVL